MPDYRWRYRPTPLAEIRRQVRKLAYLGSADRILTYLGGEYGPDRPLPSRAFIQSVLDDHGRDKRRRVMP